MTRHAHATMAIAVAFSALPVLAQTPLDTIFTYQGQLKQSGQPFGGDADFEFALFDSAVGGTQIGSTIALADQPVSNGLFTVSLDFGAAPFAGGEARWLEIRVEGETLVPRQPVRPTPYALYALGAPWDGLTGVPAGFADGIDDIGGLVLPYAGVQADPGTLFAINNTGIGRAIDATSSGGVAIQATSPGNGIALLGIGTVTGSTGAAVLDAAGVRGEATNAAGQTYGVRGETRSTALNASGVRGLATAATGATNGVWGTTASATDLSAGVFGQATSAAGVTFAVLGQNASGAAGAASVLANTTNAAPPGATYGLRAINVGALDVVRGASGLASSAAAVRTYGVQGQTNATGPFAAGIYGLASTTAAVQVYGVRGQNVATSEAAAGLLGQGNGVAAPGVPNAAALELSNGAFRVSGPVRPAGQVCPDGVGWTPIESCNVGLCGNPNPPHSHTIGWFTDIPLINPLIIDGSCPVTVGSIIQASVETEDPPPPWTSWYVQVHSKAAGVCTFRVSRMGSVKCACTPPTEVFWVNYLIINPAAPGLLVSADGGPDAEPPAHAVRPEHRMAVIED
ncbi:MAG: hypothetical protein AB7Q17_03745 [Phycisphaerae bacterium]